MVWVGRYCEEEYLESGYIISAMYLGSQPCKPECEGGLSESATFSDVFPRYSLFKPGALWQMTMPQYAADAWKALCAYGGRGSYDECRFVHQREHPGIPPPWQRPHWPASDVIALSLLDRPRKPSTAKYWNCSGDPAGQWVLITEYLGTESSKAPTLFLFLDHAFAFLDISWLTLCSGRMWCFWRLMSLHCEIVPH
jgi:hypothetical protein